MPERSVSVLQALLDDDLRHHKHLLPQRKVMYAEKRLHLVTCACCGPAVAAPGCRRLAVKEQLVSVLHAMGHHEHLLPLRKVMYAKERLYRVSDASCDPV